MSKAPLSWADLVPHLTGVASLATAAPDATPHVAAVAPILDGDLLWIFTRRSSRKARNIADNPGVALMWRPSAEVYVSGWAQLVEDLDTKTRLWLRTDLPFDPAGFFGAAENPDFVLVRVVPERGVLFDHSGRSLWSR